MAKQSINKTNAARLLDRAKIAYELIPYEVDENDLAATHVAESLGEPIERQGDLPGAARRLAQQYGVSVLLKAGHLVGDELIDIFYNYETGEVAELSARRVDTPNTHGTGCPLSSAFAAHLAKGLPLTEAARAAKAYINNAIIYGAAYKIGNGHGPVCHFY